MFKQELSLLGSVDLQHMIPGQATFIKKRERVCWYIFCMSNGWSVYPMPFVSSLVSIQGYRNLGNLIFATQGVCFLRQDNANHHDSSEAETFLSQLMLCVRCTVFLGASIDASTGVSNIFSCIAITKGSLVLKAIKNIFF